MYDDLKRTTLKIKRSTRQDFINFSDKALCKKSRDLSIFQYFDT